MRIEKCYEVEAISSLYYDFLYEIYTDRCIATLDQCKNIVQEWVDAKLDLYGLFDDTTIIGFSLSYIDTNSGTLKPVYRAEITYVIPFFRKTKGSYDLLTLPIKMAKMANLPVVSKSTVHNGVNNMHNKLRGQLIFEERILQC